MFTRLVSDTAFTAFYLGGKTGRRFDAFMPPRLLLVTETPDASGEIVRHVVRDQAEALGMLNRALSTTRAAPAGVASTPIEEDVGALDEISDILTALRHWDLRPDRVDGLLEGLAEILEANLGSPEALAILSDTAAPDAGVDSEALFGDLTLESLELIADRWASHLMESWCEAKTAATKSWTATKATEPVPGRPETLDQFRARPVWEVNAVIAEMRELIGDLRFADRERSKALQDRVRVIMKAEVAPG